MLVVPVPRTHPLSKFREHTARATPVSSLTSTLRLRHMPVSPNVHLGYSSLKPVLPVPGPTPFGTTSPSVATTAWPTAATWNTAQQPKTIPTTAPPGASTPTGPAGPTTGPSSPSGPTTGPTSPSSPTQPTTAPPAPSNTGTVAQYGQCGGIGWTGPTVCAGNAKCTQLNDVSSLFRLDSFGVS